MPMETFLTQCLLKPKRNKKYSSSGVPVAQGLSAQYCLYEDVVSIPGLTQWIKGLALPQAEA